MWCWTAVCLLLCGILMIVFGDSEYSETAANYVSRLRVRIGKALASAPISLDTLRTVLVFSGELEQALEDAAEQNTAHIDQAALSTARAITMLAAKSFHAAWTRENTGSPSIEERGPLIRLRSLLDSIADLGDTRLAIRMPEGFAFYGLLPEQYLASAAQWIDAHRAEEYRQATVVGIRTIGSTLSAIVAVALEAATWRVHRFTLRPSGLPFNREVKLSPKSLGLARRAPALVVDEGPGMSGSSMAAVAEALLQAGVPRSRISFLPHHALNIGLNGGFNIGSNGGSGFDSNENSKRPPENSGPVSDRTLEWWSSVKQYWAPLESIRFCNGTLGDELAVLARELCDEGVRAAPVTGETSSRFLEDRDETIPTLCSMFEKPKYLFGNEAGKRLLFKFQGFCSAPGGNESLAEMLCRSAAEQCKMSGAPPPIGVHRGFAAIPWVNGSHLSRSDTTPEVLRRIGDYVAGVAGARMTADEYAQGASRLNEMLYWNTFELLGERTADGLRQLVTESYHEGPEPLAYGDGRLSPEHWLMDQRGEIVKVSTGGHEFDHTVVGKQPIAWDLAGAIVEWELDSSAVELLLKAFRVAGGELPSRAALKFFELAYAAFRAGQLRISSQATAAGPEKDRANAAANRYLGILRNLSVEAADTDKASVNENHPPQAVSV